MGFLLRTACASPAPCGGFGIERRVFEEKKWVRLNEVVYEMKKTSVPKKYESQSGLFPVYIFGSSGRGNGGGVDKALSAQ